MLAMTFSDSAADSLGVRMQQAIQAAAPAPMSTGAKIGVAAGIVAALAVGAGIATIAIKHKHWPLGSRHRRRRRR